MKHNLNKDIKVLKAQDHVLTGEFFNIYLDSNTGIFWTSIKKDHNHLKYYMSEKYIPHSNKKGFFGFIYSVSQSIMFLYKRNILKKHLSPKSHILDYGSGDGKFADYLNKQGFKITKYDPVKGRLKKTQEIDYQLDMIMLWHVLEHIPDLHNTMKSLIFKLENKGTFVIALPNRDSLDSKIFKEKWAAWDVPRHLYHFNHDSIIKLMNSYGFFLKSKHPLFLDAFYVSYLSAKIKKSKFPWLQCLTIGVVSNLFALFSKQYSSSIYIFKKI